MIDRIADLLLVGLLVVAITLGVVAITLGVFTIVKLTGL